MTKRQQHVDERLKALGKERALAAVQIGGEGPSDGISGALLLAIGIRESGLRQVLGDDDHARGVFQIHDAYHARFLKGVPGCKAVQYNAKDPLNGVREENWEPVPGKTAMSEGCAPTFEDGCRYAVQILRDCSRQAVRAEVTDAVIEVALAAYNCGFRRALQGYRKGNVDMHTAIGPGGRYVYDVLKRRTEVNQSRVLKNWLS